ncbi:UDP-glycosyltransferase 76B1-like isoform X3 [Benincasa hispida]|uniref:UDP-glycosyltransferase 76B1-like isoform X3 n=1 Tax=Benincasa hispida TaxID=102211 RepID=UPI00190190AB|nr:UDP-glycosyltransferase 76B1-like isoform X3 [Benincasa hispida]
MNEKELLISIIRQNVKDSTFRCRPQNHRRPIPHHGRTIIIFSEGHNHLISATLLSSCPLLLPYRYLSYSREHHVAPYFPHSILYQLASDDVLISVGFCFSEGIYVADDLQIFRIVLRTSSAANYIGLSILDENDCHPSQERQMEEPVAGFPFLRIKDMPLFSTQNHTRKVLTCIYNGTKTASAIIWNSLWCLEHALFKKIEDETLVPVFPIGPLQKHYSNFSTNVLSEEQSCIAWLDKQAPSSVVYVSTGSVITMSKDELLEMAWGLANSDQPFLWVVRACLVNGSDGVEQLPREFHEATRSRCRIASWLPQQKVLAHKSIGCFLTHNGWNSTIESIAEGIPMLCWPRVGDQRVNARFVSHVWRVGLQLEDRLLRDEIDRAIRTLFMDEEGIKIQKQAKELKKNVEISLRQGGASSDFLARLVKYIRLQETMIRLSNA